MTDLTDADYERLAKVWFGVIMPGYRLADLPLREQKARFRAARAAIAELAKTHDITRREKKEDK